MLRIVRAGLALTAFSPFGLLAQRNAGTSGDTARRIGFLALRPMPELLPNLSAFKDGLRELGRVNVVRATRARHVPSRCDVCRQDS
jgi:hypothetical protein